MEKIASPSRKPRASAGRGKLIAAALKLFGERSFADVSTREIANEADVSLQLIWHHFSTKEVLRDTVDDYVVDRLSLLSKDLGSVSGGIEERFRQLGERVDELVRADGGQVHAYWRRMLFQSDARGRRAYAVLVATTNEILQSLPEDATLNGKRVNQRALFVFMLSILAGPILLQPFLEGELSEGVYESNALDERIEFYAALISRLSADQS